MQISEVIKALDKCLNDYSNSYGFFERALAGPEVKSVLMRLQACKSHLEVTLKKHGDQTMDWLDPAYCLVYFEKTLSVQKILRILEKEVESKSREAWSIKFKPFFEQLISQLNNDPIFRVQIDERLDALRPFVTYATFRAEYNAIAILKEKDLLVQNADQLAKLLKNPSSVSSDCLSVSFKDYFNEIVKSFDQCHMLNQENFKKLLETVQNHGNYFLELIIRNFITNSHLLNQQMFDDMIKYLPVYKSILKADSAYIFPEIIGLCNQYQGDVTETQRNLKLLIDDYNLTLKVISKLKPEYSLDFIGNSPEKFLALKRHVKIIDAGLQGNRRRAWITPASFNEMISLCEQHQKDKDTWPAVSAVRLLEAAYIFGNHFPAIARDKRRFALLKKHMAIFEVVTDAFATLPPHLLTPEAFDAMIRLCERNQNIGQASQALHGMIRRLMRGDTLEAGVNYGQSIHAPSVERSISHSMMRLAQTGYDLSLKVTSNPEDIILEALEKSGAQVPTLIKLTLNAKEFLYVYGRVEEGKMQVVLLTNSQALQAIDFKKQAKKRVWVSKYQNQEIYQVINLAKGHFPQGYSKVINDKNLMEQAIKELQQWAKSLSDKDPKQKAAKSAVGKLTDVNYHYVDVGRPAGEGSQLTTRQMLTLIWTAIHDDTRRVSNLDDAKAMLIEGFYEIQRGYNLDAKGKDNLAKDRPICTGGSFNKVVEKLQGIHPDVQIDFITKQTFTLKLPSVVMEEVIKHVEQYPEDSALIQKEGNFSSVTDRIKDAVKERMWEEFGETLCVGDAPIMPRNEFDATIDSIGSVQPNLQCSFLLTFYSVVIEEAMNYLKQYPEDSVLIQKAGDFSPIAEKIEGAVVGRLWNEFGAALCGGDKPIMTKEGFNKEINAIVISQVKRPKNFGENAPLIFVQPEEEVKPKITTIHITLQNVKGMEVGKLSDVDINTSGVDMMDMIKKQIDEREEMIVKVTFSGQNFTSMDNDKKKNALQVVLEKRGLVAYTVKVSTSKKTDLDRLKEAVEKKANLMVQTMIETLEDEEDPLKEPLIYLKVAGGQHELEALSRTLAEFKSAIDMQCEFLQGDILKLQLTSANPPLSVEFYDAFEKTYQWHLRDLSTRIGTGFSSFFKEEVTSKELIEAVKEIVEEGEQSKDRNIVLKTTTTNI